MNTIYFAQRFSRISLLIGCVLFCVTNGLVALGQPVTRNNQGEIVKSSYSTSTTDNARVVRVSLVLPFKSALSEGNHSLEFYRGFLLAADEMKGLGYHIQIAAFDEGMPNQDLSETFNKAAMHSDLMIGFYYRNHILSAGKYCATSSKMVAFPFASYIPIDLRNNGSCIFPITTEERYSQLYARLISNFYGKCNIIYLRSSLPQATSEVSELNSLLKKSGSKVKTLEANFSVASFIELLSPKRTTLVITDTNDENTLRRLFSKIGPAIRSASDCRVVWLATSSWSSMFERLTDSTFGIETCIPLIEYQNNTSSSVANLNQRYLSTFHRSPSTAVPSPFLLGYDYGMMLIENMARHGNAFVLHNSDAPRCITKFAFARHDNGCWTNDALRLLVCHADGKRDMVELNNPVR